MIKYQFDTSLSNVVLSVAKDLAPLRKILRRLCRRRRTRNGFTLIELSIVL